MTTLLADSAINDRLVKLWSLINQSCLVFIDVIYFGAVNFVPQKLALQMLLFQFIVC